MIVFYIVNKATGREKALAGHTTWTDAARRAGLNPEEWFLDSKEYID